MRKMMNILFLLTLCDETLAYATCPGDFSTYVATGLPEQWPCHGACISVDEACDGECFASVYCGRDDKGVSHNAASCSQCGSQCGGFCRMKAGECVDANYQGSVFFLNNNRSCTRQSQWLTCDSSTGSTVSWPPCTPGSPGCQPLHVPCGGKCPGGGEYDAFWKCPNEQRCILSALVCSGLGPFCSDGSDQSNNTCFMTGITECPRVDSRFPVSRSQHCKGAGRYQCVKPVKGINCLDVSDQHKNTEEIVSGNNTDKSELVKKLPTCTTWDGSEGLECLNNECIEMSAWCSPTYDKGAVCKLQADPLVEVSDVRHAGSVCTDKEFWEGRPCDHEGWQRCSGTHPGQCYYKSFECITTTGSYGTCDDSSHRICHSNETYTSDYGVMSTGEKVCSGEEMFRCESGDTCVDSRLVCDGTPQCPDGSDEDSKKCKCPWILSEIEGPDLLKNRNVSAATVQCIDNRFPGLNISTCAVRCDGRLECLAGEDEKGCKEDETKFWCSVAAIVTFFVVASFLVVHLMAPPIQRKMDQGEQNQENEIELVQPSMNHEPSTRMINLICNPDPAGTAEDERKMLMASFHKNPDFSEKIQMVGTAIQLHRSKAEVERRNQVLLDLESDYHEGSGYEICLKNNLGTNSVTEAVLKGETQGLKDQLVQFIGTWLCCCCEMEERVFRLSHFFSYNKTIQIMAAVFEMAFYYVDLLKDLAVVYVMFTLTTTNDLQYGMFLVTFNGALLIIMVWSIAASILLTSAFLTGSHPGVELQLLGVKRSGLLNLVRLLTFFLSLLVPTTLIYQLTRQRITLKDLELRLMSAISSNQGQVDPRDIRKLREQKERVNLLDYLTYFRQKNDLVLEIVIQASVNIVMILVVKSAAESLTETGLQAVFSGSTELLAIGFAMSIKKIITANIKLVAADKNGFLPFTGKCLKAIGYLLTSLVRIGCVTLFCGLPLGILNILVHKNSLTKYNRDSRSLIYDVKVEDGIVSLKRMNETYTISHYTEFTGIRLGWYGVIFFIAIIVHIILVTLTKNIVFSEAFSQLSKMEKFLHVLHTVAFPEASVDWDHGSEGTLEVYKKQWDAFKNESIFMVALFTVENILMAVPVVYICSNVIYYHESLPYTNAIEKEAYETARLLRIVWPVVVLVTPILQGLLLFIYNKKGHPWKAIYAKFGEITKVENVEMDQVENTDTEIDAQAEMVQVVNTDTEIDAQAKIGRPEIDGQMEDLGTEAIFGQMEGDNEEDLEHMELYNVHI